MSDLQEISRVVYRHDWTSVDQWASTLDQLADLSDDEIVELEHIGNHPSPSSRNIGDRPAARRHGSEVGLSRLGSWASVGFWAHVGFWSHAMISFRRGCRTISLF